MLKGKIMGLFDSIKESIKESYNDFQEGRRYYKDKYEWRDDEWIIRRYEELNDRARRNIMNIKDGELSALHDIMRERDLLDD